MPEGETAAELWAQADMLMLATGIYMERFRIGLFSARAELNDQAARRGVDQTILAHEIVTQLDQPQR